MIKVSLNRVGRGCAGIKEVRHKSFKILELEKSVLSLSDLHPVHFVHFK